MRPPLLSILCLVAAGCGEASPNDSGGLDFFASFPACTAEAGDGRLDLVAGCVDGVCTDHSYAEWVATLGDPSCDESILSGKLDCFWGGIRVIFDDADEDGVIDDTSESVGYFYVEEAYDGATVEGLTHGVELRCFVEAYGDPAEVSMELVEDEYAIYQMKYDVPDILLRDRDLVGVADELVVYSP